MRALAFTGEERRIGIDRRRRADAHYRGPERRKGIDRRAASDGRSNQRQALQGRHSTTAVAARQPNAHRLGPVNGHPFLSPLVVVMRIAKEFAYIEACEKSGQDQVEEVIRALKRSHRNADAELVAYLAHLEQVQERAVHVCFGDDPGWGESLFLKDVWPEARLLALLEFYYAARGLDFDFDAEFARREFAREARIRTKNAYLLLTLEDMDWGLSPTHFQASTLPRRYHDKLSVVFDGIDTELVRPDPGASLKLKDRTLRAGDEVLTFVNRNLEPYRGYHIFMRALPEILKQRPNAVVLIVGGDEVSYGAAAPAGKTWKQVFLDEVKERVDSSRVVFLGRVPYANYLKVLQVSRCHVYLTYPFVLGWSCIEAMSAGCLVIGSRTPPVEEVIEHGKNGLLVGFFDAMALAETVVEGLARPEHHAPLRAAARQTALERYDLKSICLPQQIALIERLAKCGE